MINHVYNTRNHRYFAKKSTNKTVGILIVCLLLMIGLVWFLRTDRQETIDTAIGGNIASENNDGAAPADVVPESGDAETGATVNNTEKPVAIVPDLIVPTVPENKSSTSPKLAEEKILLNVPFTSQAPFGEWSDPHQQEGCEEASSLMAILWARGVTAISKEEAKKAILEISTYEETYYNNFHDTSAADTYAIIIKDYFKYDKAELSLDANTQDIKRELAEGHVLIMPMDGKKLMNPNFTAGGPDRHMLVIRGYDPARNEFITNDPGTRKGEAYRYSEKTINDAWRDYISGIHVPIPEIHKNMIIVSPEA